MQSKKALVFGVKQNWDKAYLPPVIFAEYLADKGYEVYYIADDLSFFHLKKWGLAKNTLLKMKNTCFYGLEKHNVRYYTGLIIFPEFLINKFYSFLFRFFNLKFKSKKVKAVLKNEYDIVWSSSYRNIKLFMMTKGREKIFSIEDNVRSFHILPEKRISFVEKVIKESSEIKLLCTSKALIKEKYNFATYYSNGLNSNFKVLPFKNTDGKKCVYVGAIEDWFDWDLVNSTFSSLKVEGFSLDIYGFSSMSVSQFIETKNVSYKGEINNEAVQAVLSKYDIGIIPFKVNDLIEYVNPIKLYEYLASGLKVLSLSWKELREIDPSCTYLSSRDDYCDNLVKLSAIKFPESTVSVMQDALQKRRYNYIFNEILEL